MAGWQKKKNPNKRNKPELLLIKYKCDSCVVVIRLCGKKKEGAQFIFIYLFFVFFLSVCGRWIVSL